MINGRERYKNLLAAASIAGFLALVFFSVNGGELNINPVRNSPAWRDAISFGVNPAAYANQLSNAFFSWFGGEIASPAARNDGPEVDRDDGDGILLNPLDYGLPANAKEIPERRTAQSATFEIAPGKYAAVGVSDYLFAKNEAGQWVIASDIGRQEGDFFVFDRLKGGVRLKFGLNHPYYLLQQGDYWVLVSFLAPAKAAIKDSRSILYKLNDNAVLVWRVDGNQIEKQIKIDKPGPLPKLGFAVTQSGNLIQEEKSGFIFFKNSRGNQIFSIKPPVLMSNGGDVLGAPIKLIKKDDGYHYSYSTDNLIYPYVIDPSAGPNSPVTAANDTAIGTVPWNNPPFVSALDGFVANATMGPAETSQYLKATGFGFAIPGGAVINGIMVEWNRKSTGGTQLVDASSKIVKGGVIGMMEKSISAPWPLTAAYNSYGGSIDLWGETWTDADVNNVNFGAAIAAENMDMEATGAELDHVRITVYYTSGGPQPAFDQSAYRFFNNLNSTDVGAPLASQDTAVVLNAAGNSFRLRQLIHVSSAALGLSGQSFKLQYAAKSGACDTGFVGETYADVTAGTVIAYNNNATPADGDALTANANDPVHGSDSVFNQTYEEGNNFTNSQYGITVGVDGRWDFSLKDNGAPAGTGYCFRAVKADDSLLDTYSVIPEITTTAAAAAGVTINPTSGSTSSCPTSTTFTIVLNTQPTSNVQVNLNSTSLNRGTPSPPSAAFTTANWATPATITVTGGSEVGSYGIAFSVSSTDANYNGLSVPNYSATNNSCLMAGVCQYNIADYGAGQKIISLSSAVSGVVKKVQIILTIVGSVITIDSWQNVP